MILHRRHFLLASLMLPSIAAAQDEGLYQARIPAGHALLRVIFDQPNQLELAGAQFAASNPSISPYQLVKIGELSEGALEDQKSYSYLAGPTPKLIEDPDNPPPARALLRLYNLTAQNSVSLQLAGGGAQAISNVTPTNVGEREVNPIEARFEIATPQNPPFSLPALSLRRQSIISFIAFEQSGQLAGLFAPNQIAPT